MTQELFKACIEIFYSKNLTRNSYHKTQTQTLAKNPEHSWTMQKHCNLSKGRHQVSNIQHMQWMVLLLLACKKNEIVCIIVQSISSSTSMPLTYIKVITFEIVEIGMLLWLLCHVANPLLLEIDYHYCSFIFTPIDWYIQNWVIF